MATQSKRSAVNAANQAKAERAAQTAGIAAAFGEAAKLGPQVFTLQQALVAGMVRSQEREAARLRARYGGDDPRVADAGERAARYGEMKVVVDERVEMVGHVAETLTRDGLFQGYVVLSGGEPAAGYTVRLELKRDASGKRGAFRGSAKTDARGHFRIDLGVVEEPKKEEVQDVIDRWSQRVARAMASADVEAQAAAPEQPVPAPAQAEAGRSYVSVLDQAGSLVFEDPEPPAFDPAPSEFRYYVVEKAAAPQAAKPRRKG
jgi:hypothetical protein